MTNQPRPRTGRGGEVGRLEMLGYFVISLIVTVIFAYVGGLIGASMAGGVGGLIGAIIGFVLGIYAAGKLVEEMRKR